MSNDVLRRIGELYASREKPALKLRQIVALVLPTQRGKEIQAKYLNGSEPVSGSDLGDRLYAAREIRVEAHRIGMTVPASIKDLDVAKAMYKEMKVAGLPLTRSGRIQGLVE